MADYKGIKGTTIQNFTADPDDPIEGQVWYDSTAATLQYEIPNLSPAGAWRTVSSLNTARYNAGDQIGTSSSGLAFGGSPAVANAENWDGSAWS